MSKEILLSKLDELREKLGSHLVQGRQVSAHAGVKTGWAALDEFVAWRGFPKGAVSLLISEAGGATTLWTQAAARLNSEGRWAAWVNAPDNEITPWNLRREKVNLGKLLWVGAPADHKQTLWALQELMSLSLFEMIGCDLGRSALKEHQVLKLKKLAMRYQTAVVLFTTNTMAFRSSFYSLILGFQKERVNVFRALHRPTPHALERRTLYADTLPLLTAGSRALGR